VTTINRPKAVAYYRVSTKSQERDGAGLDTQRDACRTRAETWGYELVEEFEDAGLSGDDSTRPAWTRLLSQVPQREFEAIFVYNVDRWSRDIVDGFTARKVLERYGVALYEAPRSHPVDLASEDGYRDYSDDQVDAEKWKRKHLRRTVEGQRNKGRRGEWPGGRPSFGWTLKGIHTKHAEPIVDRRAREVLEVAYDLLVVRRLNSEKVASRLNDLGLPTWTTLRNEERTARDELPNLSGPVKWNPAVLRRTLDNPTLYTGLYEFGSTNSGVKPGGDEALYKRSRKTKLKWDGSAKWGESVTVNLPDPPFTKQQWDAINRALKRSSTRGKSAEAKTQMLSTRLVGACGNHYIGVSLKDADDVYRCSGRKHLRGVDKCTCRQVNAPTIDARVWAQVKQLFESPERLEAIARL
jgi:site-specific DNA recombinase